MSSNKHNNSDDGWAFAILCAYLWKKHKINKEEKKSKPMSTTKIPFWVSFLVIVVCIITIVLALNFEISCLAESL